MEGQWRRLIGRLDVVALPLLFVVVHFLFLQPKGSFGSYNSLIGLAGAAATLLRFLRYTFVSLPGSILQFMVANLWTVGLVAAGLLRLRGAPDEVVEAPLRMKRLAAATILAGGAVAAYVLAGKHPIVGDWAERHALLLGLPVAALVLEFVRWNVPGGARNAVLSLVLAGLLLSELSNSIHWQARNAVCKSVVANLARLPAPSASVLLFSNAFDGPGRPAFSSYDYTAFSALAWNDRKRLGVRDVSEIGHIPEEWHDRYRLEDYRYDGCVATVDVRRSLESSSEFGVALQYTWLSLFRKSDLPRLLAGLTVVEVDNSCLSGVPLVPKAP